MWVEKHDAELEMAQKKLETENARATTTKVTKLRFTPFKGTPTDLVRFENLFVTQVHRKPSFKRRREIWLSAGDGNRCCTWKNWKSRKSKTR